MEYSKERVYLGDVPPRFVQFNCKLHQHTSQGGRLTVFSASNPLVQLGMQHIIYFEYFLVLFYTFLASVGSMQTLQKNGYMMPVTLGQSSSGKGSGSAFKPAKPFGKKYAASTLRSTARAVKVTVAAAQASAPIAPSQTERPMNIVFISTEVAPWSKTGD